MKKLLATALAVTMTLSVAALPMENSGLFSGNKTITASAETSGNYEYEILDDGTVKITGYSGSETDLTIPSTIADKTVTSIGYEAFYDCQNLVSVTIPDSITKVEDEAFLDCISLTSITIPDSVTNIGHDVFCNTPWLETKQNNNPLVIVNGILIDASTSKGIVTVPDNVTSIGEFAFSGCTSLTKIIIPNSVKSIGFAAFQDCSNLEEVTIPQSIIKIEPFTFDCCIKLKKISLPNSITDIGAFSFRSCYCITSMVIPNSTTSIEESAFGNCKNLKSLMLSNNVKKIGESALYGCTSLKEIVIPKLVNNIENYALGYYSKGTNTTKISDFKIKCYKGTAGEKYAKDNGFNYDLWNKSSFAHSYKNINVKPTYFAKGYTAKKCSTCGAVTGKKETAMLTMSAPKSTSSANSVKLSWSKVSGAKGYVVYQKKSGKWSRIKVTSSNFYTVSKLKSGTTYQFCIKPYKTSGSKTVYGNTSKTLTTSTNPATVNFKLTAGSKKAAVKWSKVTGASGYKIYYKTSKNGSWKYLKTVNNKTTNYTKTGLAKGKTYYFTVRAYRTTGGKTYNGGYAAKSVKIK